MSPSVRKEKLITAPKGPDGSTPLQSSASTAVSPQMPCPPLPVLRPSPSCVPRPVPHPCLSCILPAHPTSPGPSCVPACPASLRPSRIPARPVSPPVPCPRPSRILARPTSLSVPHPRLSCVSTCPASPCPSCIPSRPGSPPVPSPLGCCPEPLRPGTSVLHLAVAPGSFHTRNHHTDLEGGAWHRLVTASRGF